MGIKKYKRTIKRFMRRWSTRARAVLVVVCALLLVVSLSQYMSNRRISINPAAHAPLLTLIGRVESSDNYNAYFGNAGNNDIKFTDMTIAEVQRWQETFIAEGNPSSAVGRYQIISTTLKSLVEELNIDTSEKFDKAMQDRLAIFLIERRGAVAYVNEEITREQFAANLAKEWAALPKVIGDNPEQSYYASDGLNKSRVKANQVLEVIQKAYS